MPARKRQSGGTTGRGDAKRKKQQTVSDEQGDEDDFFLASEDEKEAAAGDLEETEERLETAEEKRLRLAKVYLKQLRASGAIEDEADDEEAGLGTEELGERLKQQAQEAGGYLQRYIAERLTIPHGGEPSTSGGAAEVVKLYRCHRDAVTGLALTHDDTTVYSVGKEGGICRLDIGTGTKSNFFRPGAAGATEPAAAVGPDWVKQAPRKLSSGALLAVAVSSDGQLLAAGGGDRRVHVWDTRTVSIVHSYPGHKDAITGLAFRHGTHELYSASYDRSIKIWSLDDRAYVDTLFGHQAEVLAVDALRQERLVSVGHDHTCRVWKVPEESQLIYRAHSTALDCCRYVTGTEWVTGGNNGSLCLWSQMKKKPACIVRDAHNGTEAAPVSRESAASWVQSVAVCRGSDLLASGAGDGFVRLWQVQKAGPSRKLQQLGGLPASGFVNALAIASSGRFVVAGLGQEPRLGRWAREPKARCGLLVHQLDISDES